MRRMQHDVLPPPPPPRLLALVIIPLPQLPIPPSRTHSLRCQRHVTSARSLSVASFKPQLGANLAQLDEEQFTAKICHSDNASHLKSSGNLHY